MVEIVLSDGVHVSNESAVAYLDGALGSDAKSRIAAHIDACPACFDFFLRLVEAGTRPSTGTEADADVDPPRPHRIGRLEVLERVGAGAMGTVYRALDPALGREVAIKILRVPGAGDAGARHIAEARALAEIRHPNVVAIYDVGEFQGRPYIVMEYVHGPSLRIWLRSQARSNAEILQTFRSVNAGLSRMHLAGLVHRDVKPDNILCACDGRVLLCDLGLATPAREPLAGESPGLRELAGTPLYMSPEQICGEQIDARSDQFSLCASLCEALCGPDALRTGSRQDELSVRVRRHPRWRCLPRRLRRVVLRGLNPVPDRRFHSIDAFDRALRDALSTPRSMVIASIATVGTLAGVVMTAMPAPSTACPHARPRWDEEHRARVLALASEKPGWYPRDTALHMVRTIDEHVAHWWTIAAQSCNDAPESNDLRSCLDEARVALDAWTDELEDPNGYELPATLERLHRFKLPAACFAAAPEAASGASSTGEIGLALGTLEAAEQHLVLGHCRIAIALASEADRQATGAGDDTLGARAGLALARGHAECRDPLAALDAARRAGLRATAAHADEVALEAWTAALFTAAQARDGDALREASAAARAAWLRLDKPPLSSTYYFAALSVEAEFTGDFPLALAYGLRALASADQSNDARAGLDIVMDLWALAHRRQRRDELRTWSAEFQRRLERLPAAEHLVRLLYSADEVWLRAELDSTGPDVDAELIRTCDELNAEVGPATTHAAMCARRAAIVLRRRGQAEALPWARRSVASFAAALGDGHPETVRSRYELARVQRSAGDIELAHATLLEALDHVRARGGERHPQVVDVFSELAHHLFLTGRRKQARAMLQAALELAPETRGGLDLNADDLRHNMAEIELADRR